MKAKVTAKTAHRVGPRLRVYLGIADHLGPGKADLLTGIDETGSIVAAGKRMNMSYRRAWLLVDAMNKMFRLPLVTKSKGGKGGGGGAELTALGREVLTRFRRMEKKTAKAIASDLTALRKVISAR